MRRIFVFEYLTGTSVDLGAPEELFAQGLAMRDAVAADLVHGRAFEVSVAAGAQVRAAALPASTVRPRAGEVPEAFVARQAAAHDLCWVIAPETDGILVSLQTSVAADRWLGCDAGAIALATSKQATLAALAAAGVTTPLAPDLADQARRWVVKPDDGAGALDTHLHESRAAARADLDRRRAAGVSATLEAWVEGDALSLSLLCRHDGVELLSVNQQRLSVDQRGMVAFDGVTPCTMPIESAEASALHRLAERIHAALPGLRGFVGVDLVWHRDAGPVTIEINPRVTSAYVGLSAVLGRNLAADVVAAHMEEYAHA